jgi:hypothetical protein
MPIPHERNTIGDKHDSYLYKDGPGPGLEPIGGEFQRQFETVYPGGGAHFITLLHSIFVLMTVF